MKFDNRLLVGSLLHGLRSTGLMFTYRWGNDGFLPPHVEAWRDAMADLIGGAHKFHLCDASEFMSENLLHAACEMLNAGVLQLPFEVVYFDGIVNNLSFACLMQDVRATRRGRAVVCTVFLRFPNATHWTEPGIIVRLQPGPRDRQIFTDKRWTESLYQGTWYPAAEYFAEKLGSEYAAAAALVCINAVAGLSSPQVRMSEHTPPAELNAQRVADGREPFYSYHLLGVDLDHTHGGGRSKPTGQHKRLHWTRGHLRRFINRQRLDRPIPIPPYLSGRAPGFADKDYKL